MLKVNGDGSFVYLKKEFKQDPKVFQSEQDKAVYKLGGKEHKLEFDGKVDQVVLGKMSKAAREEAITDIRALAPMLDKVHDAKAQLDQGETVQLDLGDLGTWKGTRKEAEFKGKRDEAFDYVFTPAETGRYQTVTVTDNGYVKLATAGIGIRHEVVGKGYRNEDSGGKYKDDSVFYISEMVGVSEKKGAKPAPPPDDIPF